MAGIGNWLAFGIGVILALVCTLPTSGPQESPPLAIFGEVLDRIDRHYVSEVDAHALITGQLDPMVRQLDRNSRFFSPEQAAEFEQDTGGYFVGIGVVLQVQEDGNPHKIQRIVPGGPAEEAGLLPGDEILAVDGNSTIGLSLAQLTSQIKGPESTLVTLLIGRVDAAEGEVEIEVPRRRVQIASVTEVAIHRGTPQKTVGLIRLAQFQPGTTEEVEAAVSAMRREGVTTVILDLRQNGGGLFSEGIGVASLFLTEGLVLTTRSSRNPDQPETYEIEEPGPHSDLPLIVLIDGGTASASEVVAAALRDHSRALLVGEKSYGKWTVQDLIPIGPGGKEGLLKITTQSFHPPSGSRVSRDSNGERSGLTPDIEVEIDPQLVEELLVRWSQRRFDRLDAPLVPTEVPPGENGSFDADDPILQKALLAAENPTSILELLENSSNPAGEKR